MSQILTHNEHEKYCSENSLPRVVLLVSLLLIRQTRLLGACLHCAVAFASCGVGFECRKKGENPGRGVKFALQGEVLVYGDANYVF